MSLSNITTKNNIDIYCRSLIVDTIETKDYQIPTYGIFNGTNNTPLNVAITMQYNNNGVCTLFYDGSTGTGLLNLNTPNIKIGSASGQYNLSGLPEIRGLNGATYSRVLTTLINGTPTLSLLSLSKVSSSQFTITFTKADNSNFLSGQTFGITPFTFDFVVQE